MFGKLVSWFEEKPWLSAIITIIGAILIYHFSTLTFSSGPGIGTSNIKAILYHILAFFFFTGFLHITIIQGKNKKLILGTTILAILYAILDELHQYFIPGRQCSIRDIGLDTIGIIFASMTYLILLLRKKQ